MGIYDRDYIGADRGPRRPMGGGWGGGGLGGRGVRPPRMWSGNAWIIVICVAVFVLDALLAASAGVGVRVEMGATFAQSTTQQQRENAQVVTDSVRPSQSLPGARAHPIIDPASGEVIGEQRFRMMPVLQGMLHFSTGKGFFGLEVWRLVGFQFLHGNLTHLFFNMLGLFFFGSMVEQQLGRRLYLAFYLVCGIAGAVMYLLLNLLGQVVSFPGVLVGDIFTPLIGASAGVFGVLMAAARLAPNTTVLFMFFIPMRLSTMIYLLVGIAAFTLISSGRNAGGEAAHLGGAIAGWYFIHNAHLLGDFFEVLGPRRKKPGAPRPRREKPKGRLSRLVNREVDDSEIDRILSKIATGGMHSLTPRERKILKKATETKRE